MKIAESLSWFFDRRLHSIIFKITVGTWLLLQIAIVIVIGNQPSVSDALNYERLARECVSAGTWYPMPEQVSGHNLNPLYVCYPGFINLIALCLRLFGTIKAIYWLNIIFNCIIAWSLLRIGTDLVNKRFAYIVAFIYIIMPYSTLMVARTMSELPFMATAFAGLALIGRKNYSMAIAAGLLLALSQYIRTAGLIFAAGAIVYLLISRQSWRRTVTFSLSFILSIAATVAFNHHVSGGYTFLSSTTLGINMIMGSSDETTGEYCIESLDKPEIDEMLQGRNVFEVDSILQSLSKEWIKNNPGKWLSYIPSKTRFFLSSHPYLTYGHGGTTKQRGFWLMARRYYPFMFNILLYLTAALGIWLRRRSLRGTDGVILLVYLGFMALSWITVGALRYQLPALPCLFYFSAFAVLRTYSALNEVI